MTLFLDILLYASLAVVGIVGVAILFIGGWLIHLANGWEQCEREKP